MQITKDSVATFHYTLKNDEQQVIESSGEQPTAFLQGHNGMIRGVQKALEGKQAGDKFSVSVQPKDGYGERRDDSIQSVPVKHLIGAKKWRPGMIATVQTEHGQRQVNIVKMGKFMAKVDTNHPLAGQILHFDIEIIEVRAASAEEISHGHAHGAGGHQH
ncbi:peptidylprolyl isomerase [Cycloclasticus sp. 46_83_sub15_T18]|nr:peptidylprolyl isomerase [Cycloclasticus sp. 46_83_sub15_T18]OUR83546.1 peptidylprolyl isomerase [Cycloclasticus sp. 46_120_T64]